MPQGVAFASVAASSREFAQSLVAQQPTSSHQEWFHALLKRFLPMDGGNCRHVPNVREGVETSFGANRMKSKIMALSAVVLLMGTVLSFAQSASISIEPEQRTRIKEYVVKERVPRVVVKERYRVGTQVPADVELRDPLKTGDRPCGAIGTTTRNTASTSWTLKAAA
jgi:hypothetical protein